MPAQLMVTNGARLREPALVNQPGHHFLADAGLSRDQDLGVRSRCSIDLAIELTHCGTAADEAH